jgi:hypothetical protein
VTVSFTNLQAQDRTEARKQHQEANKRASTIFRMGQRPNCFCEAMNIVQNQALSKCAM